ncbi:unnamed protein product [Natator depressus]
MESERQRLENPNKILKDELEQRSLNKQPQSKLPDELESKGDTEKKQKNLLEPLRMYTTLQKSAAFSHHTSGKRKCIFLQLILPYQITLQFQKGKSSLSHTTATLKSLIY